MQLTAAEAYYNAVVDAAGAKVVDVRCSSQKLKIPGRLGPQHGDVSTSPNVGWGCIFACMTCTCSSIPISYCTSCMIISIAAGPTRLYGEQEEYAQASSEATSTSN